MAWPPPQQLLLLAVPQSTKWWLCCVSTFTACVISFSFYWIVITVLKGQRSIRHNTYYSTVCLKGQRSIWHNTYITAVLLTWYHAAKLSLSMWGCIQSFFAAWCVTSHLLHRPIRFARKCSPNIRYSLRCQSRPRCWPFRIPNIAERWRYVSPPCLSFTLSKCKAQNWAAWSSPSFPGSLHLKVSLKCLRTYNTLTH